jgi:hypothetical protein
MTFEARGEAVIGAHDPDELKLIFRVLHRHLGDHPELMDTHFLLELQNHLQRAATDDGVDVSDHGAWDRWLGNDDAPPCESRVARRKTIDPN